jgi:hypothetical protein
MSSFTHRRTHIGALARLIMPGKQNINIIVTILLGVVAALIGGYLWEAIFPDRWNCVDRVHSRRLDSHFHSTSGRWLPGPSNCRQVSPAVVQSALVVSASAHRIGVEFAINALKVTSEAQILPR